MAIDVSSTPILVQDTDASNHINHNHMNIISLNTEEDYPHGSWLGDPTHPTLRVRCPITPQLVFWLLFLYCQWAEGGQGRAPSRRDVSSLQVAFIPVYKSGEETQVELWICDSINPCMVKWIGWFWGFHSPWYILLPMWQRWLWVH